ncbi:hypothetical protein AQ490_01765 [Wenjunlia vitaminophila]|uniref:Uncharacterized protein n=1 Tax=Wenjunlia vitaminophila TaxID=76728 RepID=A0A0T6LY38_WENVI|nr:hypothetical protein [Wenjunlia vitaminophila]KRV50970.1 hypothetical protein AQ490_01765 [Wenjunlia vitaminophila]
MDRGEDDLELYAVFAARLKQAHARVRALDLPEPAAATLTRRLLVITAAAKHDLAHAARRLDRLMQELDEAGPDVTKRP